MWSVLHWIGQPFGWALGVVDYTFVLLNTVLGKRRPKFFAKGWGGLEPVYEAQDKMLQDCLLLQEKRKNGERANDGDGLELDWDETTTTAEKNSSTRISLQRGRFTSPLAHLLPPESRKCQLVVVKPANENDSNNGNVVVIMLPATGEMGKSTRLAMARKLAQTHGYTSVIVTAPFYGSRKPSVQNLFFLSTVRDVLLQSQAIIQEASGLVRYYLKHTSSHTKVCVTGFSWGAAMTSCVCAVALLGGSPSEGKRLACAPYVGCASPVLLADGVLKGSIDWDALAADETGPGDWSPSETESSSSLSVQKALYDELNKTQLEVITEPLQQQQAKKTLGAVRVVCMRNDHFIRLGYAKGFVRQLQALASGKSSVHVSWFPGGHIFAALMRPILHRQLVIDAVEALEKIE